LPHVKISIPDHLPPDGHHRRFHAFLS
jgi:hypothetical protein